MLLKSLVLESVKLAPSPLVLRAWALHAAENKSYISFCKKIFDSVPCPAEASREQSHYKVTINLMEYANHMKASEPVWPEKLKDHCRDILIDVVGLLMSAKQEERETDVRRDNFEEELIKEANAPMTAN